MTEKLYIGNLADELTAGALKAVLKMRGNVLEVQILEDEQVAGGERFAFVRMSSEAEAQTMIEIFDGLEVAGKHIVVSPTRAKLNEQKQGGYGGYGRHGKR